MNVSPTEYAIIYVFLTLVLLLSHPQGQLLCEEASRVWHQRDWRPPD